jgi:hypothetical protein
LRCCSQRSNVCDGHEQRRRGFGRLLSEAKLRHCRFFFRSFYPIEAVRLHVEAGGSVACRIEDLLSQIFGDFDWLKDFNCSPLEDRFQGSIHNRRHVAITT